MGAVLVQLERPIAELLATSYSLVAPKASRCQGHKATLLDGKHDLAPRPPVPEPLVRLGGLSEGEALLDHNPEPALVGEGGERFEPGRVGLHEEVGGSLRLLVRGGGHGIADALRGRDQKAVLPQRLERAQTVLVVADQVQHDVDTPHSVLEGPGRVVDWLVGPELAEEVVLLGCGRSDARAP